LTRVPLVVLSHNYIMVKDHEMTETRWLNVCFFNSKFTSRYMFFFSNS
jgi:hypothetical protein